MKYEIEIRSHNNTWIWSIVECGGLCDVVVEDSSKLYTFNMAQNAANDAEEARRAWARKSKSAA